MFVLLMAARTIAADAIPAPPRALARPEILLGWIDSLGNLKYDAVTSADWILSYRTPSSTIKTPALRLTIKSGFPQSWEPELLSSEGATVISPPRKGHTGMVVELRSTRATLRYRFTDSKEDFHEISLVIRVEMKNVFTFSTPECEKMGLRLAVQRNEAKHLYLGVSCIENADSIDLYFFRSEDSKWNPNMDIAKSDPENKATEFKFRILIPKEEVIYSKAILAGGTADEAGGLTEYAILYTPKIPPQRFYASAGVGPTVYKTYRESATGVNLTQYSMTGKVSAGYRLIPKVLDVAFNMFGNLFTLSHSPTAFPDGSELPPARFYGINGRIGYRLPIDLGATEFLFLTGWYFWGMTVTAPSPASTYGVKQLNGPQLFFMVSRTAKGQIGYWGHTKLALISDRVRLNDIRNREIAIGGGVQLSAKQKNPFALTLDIAHARFFNDDNGMTLLSISVGVQKNIW
ncbi:MAG: hypothetical protein HYW49_00090 [Deltaproteobacteria bacterium]|nr:hypothetical protein [Deltaproteobacteria bacterium]